MKNIGLIGCGNIAETYFRAQEYFNNINFVACADINLDAAKKTADQYNIIPLSVDEILNDKNVDIILNLTIPQAHYEISKRALEANKHVYCEKPMSVKFDEAKELVIEKTYLKPISVEEITEEKRGSEIRGRNLPLYKLSSLDSSDKEVNVYIDPSLGKIVAIRTFEWRLWDLMWGLHIMDWRDRDDINNLFLKIFSILALVSSITGIILFFRPKSEA